MDPVRLVPVLVCLPGGAFLALAIAWLLGIRLSERLIVRLTAAVYAVGTAIGISLGFVPGEIRTPSVDWFVVGDYRFVLSLSIDRLALPFVLLTLILTGLIGAFSARYLHRDSGFLRFFALLHLFAFGALLLFTAGSLDLLICGWELVGLTSVLLIAYFHERVGPVENSLRVFGIYRAADIGLLVGAFALHHWMGSASFGRLFRGSWPNQSTEMVGVEALVVALLMLLAASGKSAQGPFSGWLPRAMEGPTPSSAIFYGSISVHAGVYLLLRMYPVLAQSGTAMVAIAVTGVLTACFGTLVGRSCSDVKTSLAYSSLSQVGIIFLEVGLGFPTVALWHASGHAVVRTLQFLRAPSALHEYHQIHAAAGGHLEPTGLHFEALMPYKMRLWLYRLALDRGHLDSLLDGLFVAPLRAVGKTLARVEGLLTQPVPKPDKPSSVRVARDPISGEFDA